MPICQIVERYLQAAFAFLNSKTFCSTWNWYSSKEVEDCHFSIIATSTIHCKSCIIILDNHLWHLLHALLVEGVAVAKEKEHLGIYKHHRPHHDFPDHHHQVQMSSSTPTVIMMIIRKRKQTSRRTNSGAVIKAWEKVQSEDLYDARKYEICIWGRCW